MTEDAAPFGYLFRVRYSECDAQNVVFNARYADYVDLAATEFLRAIGLEYQQMLAQGLDNQVVKLEIQWRAPARFDDVILAQVWMKAGGTTSYTLAVRFCLAETGETVAEAETVYVMMDRDDWSKTPLPDWLREKLEAGARGTVTDHAGWDR